MKKKSESERWINQALKDLDDAKFNLSGKRYNVACFLAQQSAEKSLKAYLFYAGADEVWGHSVGELCSDASNFDKDFEKIKRECSLLDKYYITTRYPNALPGGIPSEVFDREDAEKAISIAEKVINFVKSKIK
jgi:HEPN domain-containing protein